MYIYIYPIYIIVVSMHLHVFIFRLGGIARTGIHLTDLPLHHGSVSPKMQGTLQQTLRYVYLKISHLLLRCSVEVLKQTTPEDQYSTLHLGKCEKIIYIIVRLIMIVCQSQARVSKRRCRSQDRWITLPGASYHDSLTAWLFLPWAPDLHFFSPSHFWKGIFMVLLHQ